KRGVPEPFGSGTPARIRGGSLHLVTRTEAQTVLTRVGGGVAALTGLGGSFRVGLLVVFRVAALGGGVVLGILLRGVGVVGRGQLGQWFTLARGREEFFGFLGVPHHPVGVVRRLVPG